MTNFINLSYEEKMMVLDWRNHPRIRNNMHLSNEISIEDHLKFINRLTDDTENEYYLLDDIGVIYFNKIIGKKAKIGLYSNPDIYGAGKTLMEKILTFNYDCFYLEVFEENIKAINLYKKFNFKEKEKKSKNGKIIVYMEWSKYENR